MTETEINQAIAEVLGTLRGYYCGHCRETRNPENRNQAHIHGDVWFCNFCDLALHRDMPDYYRDLNACAEMEKALEQIPVSGCFDQFAVQDFYVRKLRSVCWDEFHQTFLLVHATAPQRCEAFLKTIGRWKE